MADEDFSLGIFPDRCEKQNKKKTSSHTAVFVIYFPLSLMYYITALMTSFGSSEIGQIWTLLTVPFSFN